MSSVSKDDFTRKKWGGGRRDPKAREREKGTAWQRTPLAGETFFGVKNGGAKMTRIIVFFPFCARGTEKSCRVIQESELFRDTKMNWERHRERERERRGGCFFCFFL